MRILSLNIGFLGVGGGIASAARSIIDELAGRSRHEHHEVVAHSLLGHESMAHHLPSTTWVITRGFSGDKLRFSLESIRAASACRPEWLFVDHINLLPAALPIAKACGARLALFLHGKEIYGGDSRPGALSFRPRIALREAVRRADLLFANSPWTARMAVEALDLNTPPRVAWLPVAEPKLRHILRARANGPVTRERAFLVVGRIDPSDSYKGHEAVVDAMSEMPRDTRLFVVGTGGGVDRLSAFIHARNLDDRVLLLGYVDDATLATLYASTVGMIMPSSGEGLGLVYLEAMAAGCVAVGKSPGPIDDLVEFGAKAVSSSTDLIRTMQALVAGPIEKSPTRLPPFRLSLASACSD